MIRSLKIQVTTTGEDGSGLGDNAGAYPVHGLLVGFYVDWGATAPGTSKIVVVCESDDNHPEITLYDKTAANSDVWIYPVVEQVDTGGTGKSVYSRIPVSGTLKVTVTLCNALVPAVTVYAYVEY